MIRKTPDAGQQTMEQNFKVTVIPGSKKNEVKEIKPRHFEVKLKAKPERGEANEALRQILAAHFSVPVSRIRILTGRKSRGKLVILQSQ